MFLWLIFLSFLVFFIVFSRRAKINTNVEELQLCESVTVDDNSNFDVVIIGAGISGISAAHGLQKQCPNKVSKQTIQKKKKDIYIYSKNKRNMLYLKIVPM